MVLFKKREEEAVFLLFFSVCTRAFLAILLCVFIITSVDLYENSWISSGGRDGDACSVTPGGTSREAFLSDIYTSSVV